MTVPPYIPAVFITVIVAFLSDRYKMRMGFALVLLIPSIIGERCRLPGVMSDLNNDAQPIGYILAITATNNSVRYGSVFLMAAGVYPAVPCILSPCTIIQLLG